MSFLDKQTNSLGQIHHPCSYSTNFLRSLIEVVLEVLEGESQYLLSPTPATVLLRLLLQLVLLTGLLSVPFSPHPLPIMKKERKERKRNTDTQVGSEACGSVVHLVCSMK